MNRTLVVGLCALTMSLTCFGSDGKDNDDHGDRGDRSQAADPDSSLRLRTNLSGAVINRVRPQGTAEFRSEPAKKRTSLKVDVQDVAFADGVILSVSIIHAGVTTEAGNLTLSGQMGELELQSQDGDVVPQAQKGDMVVVSRGQTAILSGVF